MDQVPVNNGPASAVPAGTYDKAAAQSGWDSPSRAQWLVERYVTKDTVVLDIGIGTGQSVKGYAAKGAVIIGLDKDPQMLAAAQQVAGQGASLRQADINGIIPIKDLLGRVDVAQAIGVLEFARNLGDVLDLIKISLKPAGFFVFTIETPANGAELVQQSPALNLTVYRHTAKEVRDMLIDRDLNVVYEEAYEGYARGDTTNKVPYHIFLVQKSQ